MAVTIEQLCGPDIPGVMRASHVVTVWAVLSNGGIVKCFHSKEVAFGFAEHLKVLEEDRRPLFDPGPEM